MVLVFIWIYSSDLRRRIRTIAPWRRFIYRLMLRRTILCVSSMYTYIFYNVYCTYGTVYTGSHTAIRHFSDSYCVRGRRLYYYIVDRGGDLLSIIHTERCVHYVRNIYIYRRQIRLPRLAVDNNRCRAVSVAAVNF